MANRTLTLTPQLYEYLCSVSLREPRLLARLRQETAAESNADMQISPEQGQFMGLLAELISARKIIEVGTFTGYSSLCMALALPEDGSLVCCDINQRWTDIARRYWTEAGVEDKVQLHLAPAQQTLQGLLDRGAAGSFDMAFIDADKQNYAAYYELCLQLLRPGGLILVDNTLWSGRLIEAADRTPDTEAIRAFNSLLYEDDRISLSLLPMSDGLTLALKK
ncbi:MAG TPA: class I SAM-dependent methyltransferase [Gammaproteobacteria bacterium]